MHKGLQKTLELPEFDEWIKYVALFWPTETGGIAFEIDEHSEKLFWAQVWTPGSLPSKKVINDLLVTCGALGATHVASEADGIGARIFKWLGWTEIKPGLFSLQVGDLDGA